MSLRMRNVFASGCTCTAWIMHIWKCVAPENLLYFRRLIVLQESCTGLKLPALNTRRQTGEYDRSTSLWLCLWPNYSMGNDGWRLTWCILLPSHAYCPTCTYTVGTEWLYFSLALRRDSRREYRTTNPDHQTDFIKCPRTAIQSCPSNLNCVLFDETY